MENSKPKRKIINDVIVLGFYFWICLGFSVYDLEFFNFTRN